MHLYGIIFYRSFLVEQIEDLVAWKRLVVRGQSDGQEVQLGGQDGGESENSSQIEAHHQGCQVPSR